MDLVSKLSKSITGKGSGGAKKAKKAKKAEKKQKKAAKKAQKAQQVAQPQAVQGLKANNVAGSNLNGFFSGGQTPDLFNGLNSNFGV